MGIMAASAAASAAAAAAVAASATSTPVRQGSDGGCYGGGPVCGVGAFIECLEDLWERDAEEGFIEFSFEPATQADEYRSRP
jgi:hypothetical protein